MPFYSFGSPRKISAASYIYYAQAVSIRTVSCRSTILYIC